MDNIISIKSENKRDEIKNILDHLGPKALKEIILNKLTHDEIKIKFNNQFKENQTNKEGNQVKEKEINLNEKIKLKKSINRLDFSKMKPVAFKFMYIGTKYEGLVTQNHTNNTIEHQIFSALELASLIESPEKSNYSRCGRTDAGVSATGNVFNLNVRYKPEKEIDYLTTLNNILPNDIIIWGFADVDKTFDARFSCLFREYKYFFLRKNMNLDLMKKASKKMQGLHNFKNFCKIDKSVDPFKKSYERRIYEFKIDNYEKFSFPYNFEKTSENNFFDMCIVTIKGSAFLWHQVRCMMSIIFSIGKGLEDLNIIDEMYNIESGKIFNYEIASDLPLILSNCEYEGIKFKTSIENSANNYFNLVDIHERNIIQNYMSSFSFDYLTNIIKTSKDLSNRNLLDQIDSNLEDIKNHKCNYSDSDIYSRYLNKEKLNDKESNSIFIDIFETKFRRKIKYTKMLNHKVNRVNDNDKIRK
jgi:tRNA pseudouridine38/39 synthase